MGKKSNKSPSDETEETTDDTEQKNQIIQNQKNKVSRLTDKIDELQSENNKLKQALKQRNREIDTKEDKFQRKSLRIKKDMRKDFVADVSKIRESLILAMENVEDDCNVSQGIEMTIEQMSSILDDYDVDIIDPSQGQEFDAKHHEVVDTSSSERHNQGEISKVQTVGYRIDEEVIRPAKVVTVKD